MNPQDRSHHSAPGEGGQPDAVAQSEPDAKLIPFPTPPPAPEVPSAGMVNPEPVGPVTRAGGVMEPAPDVLDGELITDEEYARRRGHPRLPVLAVVAVVRESERTKKVTAVVVPRVARSSRVAARAVYTVGQGHLSWIRRAADALTHGHVREQVRLARVVGDREALAEWTERLVTLKDGRAQRLRALPGTLVAGLKALLVVGCGLAGCCSRPGSGSQCDPRASAGTGGGR